MKKSFFAAFLCLALVFSGCASKAFEELSDQTVDIAVDEAQNTTEEISEELASDEGELTSDEGELTSEESEENQIEAEEETEELLDETSGELLEEIEEPIVRDAPLEEEPEVSEEIENLQEEDSSTIESVEIEELEIIPEPQENDEEPVIEENILSTDDVMDVEDEISAVTEETEETEEPEEENTSENSEETEETEETETVEKEIIPSRSVKIRIGEYLDVEYPGRGWIYIGITDLSKNVTYFGRKLGTENTKYTFLGKKSGTVILHFYKEDVLTDTYIDDYLEVEIEAEKTTSKNHVTAPAYSEVVPKPVSKATKENTLPNQNFDQKDTKTESTEVKSQSSDKETKIEAQNSKTAETESPVESKTESTVQTVVKKAAVPQKNETESTVQTVVKKVAVPQKNETAAREEKLVPELSPEELLSAAKKDYENKNLESALENVKAFLLTSPSNADEGLFLLGQIYESNGQVRDIKKAVEAYEKITSSYPASQLWDDANKRAL